MLNFSPEATEVTFRRSKSLLGLMLYAQIYKLEVWTQSILKDLNAWIKTAVCRSQGCLFPVSRLDSRLDYDENSTALT